MDEKEVWEELAEQMLQGWELIPMGNGFTVMTDWHWPDGNRIEIYVRAVGDREDLYVVTDGGELFNFLFAQGVDLTKDEHAMKALQRTAEDQGAQLVDYQIAKGAGAHDMSRSIRVVLEILKDGSFMMWHKYREAGALPH